MSKHAASASHPNPAQMEGITSEPSSPTKELADIPRSSWSGKWAFILAAAASAVGLGNMWRFPYLAAKYGGGTFLFTYIILVFTFGVSLMILEIALGRKTRQSDIGAYTYFGKKYRFIGILASSVPFIITPYYCIIGGWVFKYAVSYLTTPADAMAGSTFFSSFITSNTESYLWAVLFMLVVFFVVALGVKGGIEKANLIMMPALIVMAVVLAIYVATLPGAFEGVMYYLTPDFSKISPELFIGALGQMFYSLSLAMGIMITYGSYLERKENIVTSAARIGGFDLLVSFLAGMMIVPAAVVALGSPEIVAQKAGPSLMFGVLPQVFSGLGSMASVIGFIFFLLVLFAALTSAISLTETCVSIVQDATNWTRRKSLLIACGFILACGIFVNAGYNGLSFIQPLGEGSSLLDLFDFLSNSVIMPIVALLTCIFVGWIVKPKTIIDEVEAEGNTFHGKKAWVVMIKYIAPVLIVIILVAYVASSLGFYSI